MKSVLIENLCRPVWYCVVIYLFQLSWIPSCHEYRILQILMFYLTKPHLNMLLSILLFTISSCSLFDHISEFRVLDHDNSVHFPTCCILSLFKADGPFNDNINEHEMSVWIKSKWNIKFKDVFMDKFNSTYLSFKKQM